MPRHNINNNDLFNEETDSQLSSTNYNTSEDDEANSLIKSSTTRKNLPPARNAANARERARMRVLARAFCRLKTTLPWVPADTKLSKLDTLRLATSYIAYLREVLLIDEEEVRMDKEGKKHPVTMSWPFSFGCTSASPTSNRFTASSYHNHATHQKSTNSSLPCSQKLSLSLPDTISSSPHNKPNTNNVDSHVINVINNNWEVADSFSTGIVDQNQLMSCQQHGDKDIEVSYY